VIHTCALRAIEKTSRFSRIGALDATTRAVFLPNLSAGYRPAVLNAAIKKNHKDLNPKILAAKVNVASSVNEITRKNSGSTHFPSIRRRALFFKVHHTTWCETPLPGMLAFAYLFQDLLRLLPKSGNDLCYDLSFLDGTFLGLPTVAPWK
jgi:hypothetical protein